MKNKKASHVGVILSFVIFVTFLVFLFSIFGSPIKLPSNKEPLIDYLDVEFRQKFASNLTIIAISPINSGDEDLCIAVNKIEYGFENFNTLVKDKDNNIIGSRITGDFLFIDWSGEENFFKIFYSEENFENLDFTPSGNCHGLAISEVNSVRENKYFNADKIKTFITDYESNYESLKTEFSVPQNTEFGLIFIDAEGNINKTKERDISTDIFSREIPIQYFDEAANINSGFINIKVW